MKRLRMLERGVLNISQLLRSLSSEQMSRVALVEPPCTLRLLPGYPATV